MPGQLSRFFAGRELLLAHLHEAFKVHNAVALTGLGGIGKTQTALAYANHHRQDYSAVLWVRAETREELVAGFTALAKIIGLPEQNAAEQAQVVAAVQRWLAASTDWLLILDNADDLSLVREFVPVVPGNHTGRLLLTSRDAAARGIAENLEVQHLPPEVSALFLLHRAGQLPINASLESAPPEIQSPAKKLAGELGGLPLALDQAGAYLEEMQITPGEYLKLYQEQGRILRNQRGGLATDHASVTVTFSLAFARVEESNPAAAELLRLCAFLHPNGIPEEMLTAGASELGPVLEPALAQPLGLIEMRRAASRISLLHRDTTNQTLLIHPVVQQVLRDNLDATARHTWIERAIRLVNRSFPYIEFGNWLQCERLLPQALACADLTQHEDWVSLELARLCNQTGYYLRERARYGEVESLYQRARAILEKAHGPDHPYVAISLNNLAELYRAQGKYDQAKLLHQRALAIREKTLGSDHPSVAQSLNNRAELYRAQGKYAKAEPLYQQALEIQEKALGPDHSHVAISLNNRAELYRAQGKYDQAESLHQRALVIREEALGPDHPDVAQSLNNLALVDCAQGKYAQAAPRYQRALDIVEKALDPNHPDVMTILQNYAVLLRTLKRATAAKKLEARARTMQQARNAQSPAQDIPPRHGEPQPSEHARTQPTKPPADPHKPVRKKKRR